MCFKSVDYKLELNDIFSQYPVPFVSVMDVLFLLDLMTIPARSLILRRSKLGLKYENHGQMLGPRRWIQNQSCSPVEGARSQFSCSPTKKKKSVFVCVGWSGVCIDPYLTLCRAEGCEKRRCCCHKPGKKQQPTTPTGLPWENEKVIQG